MFRNKWVSAIIPAAGSGRRMGQPESKTWLKLAGVTMLERTLLALCEGDFIDEMIVVGQASDQSRFLEVFEAVRSTRRSLAKAVPDLRFTTGGDERIDSVYRGLLEVKPQGELILVHDGARPLVTEAVIVAALEGADRFRAAVACVPAKDTVKLVVEGMVKETPDRRTVYNVQTPQCFEKALIVQAYKQAMASGVAATDDAGLVEHLGVPVKVTEGSYENIKVTTPEDVIIAEAIINNRRG